MSEVSHSQLGKVGAEAGMTAGDVLQRMFSSNEKVDIQSAFEAELGGTAAGESLLKVKGKIEKLPQQKEKGLPPPIQKNIDNLLKDYPNKSEKFHLGLRQGFLLAYRSKISKNQMRGMLDQVLALDPKNEFLQAVHIGAMEVEKVTLSKRMEELENIQMNVQKENQKENER